MPLDAVKNFAKVTVSQGYPAGATTIVLSTGDGSKLPDPATEGAFNLVWWNSTDYPDPTDDPSKEIVRCTARTGDTLTVTRGQEGTNDVNHNTANKTYKMILAITQKMIEDIEMAAEGLKPAIGFHVSQNAHGMAVGNVVRYNGTIFVKAQADSAANAEAVGMVSDVLDVDHFDFIDCGAIPGLSGLTPGSVYFLSPTVAGGITTTEPTTVGQVSKPLMIAISATEGFFFNFRGAVVASTNHAPTHQAGGGDAIKLDDLATPDDNTDLDVSTAKHGLCPKAPNDTTKFLRGDGGWNIIPDRILGMVHYHLYSDVGSFESDKSVDATITYSVSGITLGTGVTAGGYAEIKGVHLPNIIANTNNITVSFYCNISGTTVSQNYFGMGDLTTAASGITFTDAHFGYKKIMSGGAGTSSATNANGTTETATVVSDVSAKYMSTRLRASDIVFYVNKVLVATHSTNLPTNITNSFSAATSNANTNNAEQLYVRIASVIYQNE